MAYSLSFITATTPTGASEYREDAASVNPVDLHAWEVWANRLVRYQLLWAFYENTPYAEVHAWSKRFREAYGLYAHVRSIFNPANRLGEFWAQHLMGGPLDPDAGDGRAIPSALPIETENEAIRPAIARIWRDSNWQAKKTIWTRFGSTMGDTALTIVDDAARKKVYFKVVRPTSLRWVAQDPFGNVKGYQIQEYRPDPEWNPNDPLAPPEPGRVLYTETCTKDGESVTFETKKDDEPYDWRDYPPDTPRGERVGPKWTVEYGFVPLVFTQHIDVGSKFGWAEYFSLLSKIRDQDDLGSCLTDQCRKLLNGPWAVLNMRKPDVKSQNPERPRTTSEFGDRSETAPISRDKLTLIYLKDEDSASRVAVQQMVGDMRIDAMVQYIDRLTAVIEKHCPELILDDRAGSDSSGRTLRVLQEKVEAKAWERRSNYDQAMASANAMAISIGAFRRYPGFEEFTTRSFSDGDLIHRIGNRPVFSINPLDKLEREQAFWNAAVAAKNAAGEAGVIVYFQRNGWKDEEIAEYQKLRDEEAERALDRAAQAAEMAARVPNQPGQANAPRPKDSPIFPSSTRLTQKTDAVDGQKGNPTKAASRNGSS